MRARLAFPPAVLFLGYGVRGMKQLLPPRRSSHGIRGGVRETTKERENRIINDGRLRTSLTKSRRRYPVVVAVVRRSRRNGQLSRAIGNYRDPHRSRISTRYHQ